MKTKEQLDAEAAEIDRLLSRKQGVRQPCRPCRVAALADARADLERRVAAAEDPRYAALRGYGGDAGSEPQIIAPQKTTGAQLNPLAFGQKSLNAMYKAFKDRQPMTIKAEPITKSFSSVDSLLPAQLDPQVIGQIHEWRILDHLSMINSGFSTISP
jgi:hypothetical protein